MAGVIAAAGAVGGVVNALLSSSGYSIQWPEDKGGILQLGVLGNVLLGAFAALVTWGPYGPLKDTVLLGSTPTGGLPVNLTVTAVVGAALAGAGGARVVSNELDKQVLRVTGAKVAQEPANPQLAMDIATLPPATALANTMAASKAARAGTVAASTADGTATGTPGTAARAAASTADGTVAASTPGTAAPAAAETASAQGPAD